MSARVLTAPSNSDGVSSFAHSKPQLKQSAAEGDSVFKFSRMMRDSAAETTNSSSRAASAPRTASRDNSLALQQSKAQHRRSHSAQTRKTTDAPKKDKADDNSVNETTAATTPQTNDRSPLTMLFGIPTAQFDGKVVNAQKASSDDASSDAAITAKRTRGDGSPELSADGAAGKASGTATNNASTADRLPLTMLFGMPATQFSDPAQANAANTLDGMETDGNSSELSTNGTAAKASASATHANNLAFAIRVSESELKASSEIDSSSPAPQPAPGHDPKTILSPTVASLMVEASSKSDLEQNSHDTNDSQQQPFVVDPDSLRTTTTADSAAPSSEQFASTATYAAEDVNETVTSEPVKNVHMQLLGEDNKRVDVRLFDRGGELHVSVKSGDVNLTQDLQTHMHELTSRLEKQDFQTEVWMPKIAEPTKTESGNINGFSSDQENRSFSGNSEERRRGRQQQRPEWLESLES